jgi:hypothetical protein
MNEADKVWEREKQHYSVRSVRTIEAGPPKTQRENKNIRIVKMREKEGWIVG